MFPLAWPLLVGAVLGATACGGVTPLPAPPAGGMPPGAIPSGEALARRCLGVGPPQPAPPPEAACQVPPSILTTYRPNYVPGGRWFEPAPRRAAGAAPDGSGPGGSSRAGARTGAAAPDAPVQPCLDTGIFRRAFRAGMPALRCCLLASPSDQGETSIRIRMTLPCRGRAERVEVTAFPELTPKVSACLARVIGAWQFPPLRPGEQVHVVYPLRYL